MKVVFVHKFFHMVGGTEQYFADLRGILEAHGHSTHFFSLKHPKNPPSEDERYFLDGLDYRSGNVITRLPKVLGRTLYSFDARRKLGRLLDEQKPDVGHLQLIDHHISPSVLDALRDRGVPIVQSVSNYKHVCASYRLYRFDQGEICERCLYGKHYHAVLTRCHKGSLLASALVSFEMMLHGLMRIYQRVDRFVVPNRFMEEKLLGAGYPARKIARLRNPLRLDSYTPSYGIGDSILYFGRLDPEKGLGTLLDAIERLPRLRLKIIGDGQEREAIAARVASLDNVELLPPRWGDALLPHLAAARLVVLPSIWYEISPMVIYQAFAMGKAVIASDIGGIPDLLTPETGRLCAPGDADALVAGLEEIAFDDRRLSDMGRAARRWAEEHLDPENYYKRIMDVYAQAKEERA